MAVIIKDNTQEFLAELDKKTNQLLDKIGETAVIEAQRICPVKTGKLKDSIIYEKTDVLVIGSDLPYALVVEVGSRNRSPQPYLRPAMDVIKANADAIIQQVR